MVLAACFHDKSLAQDDSPEAQFKKSCGTCHAAERGAPPRQGPNLWGVYGRQSGKADGFHYSDALAAAHLTWNDDTLDRWITNARKMVPGTVMMYRQADPEKRRLAIAYLKTLGASAQGQSQESPAKSK